jgi:DNA-binding XRE family transcriptional regulator
MSQKFIGTRIKNARTKKRMKQADLARAIGRSPSMVNHWEKGRAIPSIDDLVAVSDATETPLMWLAAGRGSRSFAQAPVVVAPLSAEQIALQLDYMQRTIDRIANDLASMKPKQDER